jgi:hypothetical protein
MTTRRIFTEFPDFPIMAAPELPDGWEDTSWHHDECPSYMANGLQVFLNIYDKFFCIITDPESYETVWMTNNWDECVKYVNEYNQIGDQNG